MTHDSCSELWRGNQTPGLVRSGRCAACRPGLFPRLCCAPVPRGGELRCYSWLMVSRAWLPLLRLLSEVPILIMIIIIPSKLVSNFIYRIINVVINNIIITIVATTIVDVTVTKTADL